MPQAAPLIDQIARLATDAKYSDDSVENLCLHAVEGSHRHRMLAIEALGRLGATDAIEALCNLTEKTERSLESKGTATLLAGLAGRELQVVAEVCLALARLDCPESHQNLLRLVGGPGDIYIRSLALEAMGLECDWHDEALIEPYLPSARSITLRVGTLHAIFLTSGLPLQRYKAIVMPLLKDRSPYVVISAMEVLALLIHRDDEILIAFAELFGDHRFCRISHSTVSHLARSYVEC